jgi:ligand-binding sensor domain-containing protein
MVMPFGLTSCSQVRIISGHSLRARIGSLQIANSESEMKSKTLYLITLIFFNVLLLCTSCSGKNATHIPYGMKGDTVQELGKHLMLIYQDKMNNYWFGSWGEGLYRYDGETIIHYTTKHGLCQNKIVQILEDRYGNLYFNTDIGISKFDGQRFTTLRLNSNSTEEWKLAPDDLWFKGAQDSGVVYRAPSIKIPQHGL